ncbi:MFS transporter [Lactobacillus sp. ESL0677]|uniref:MFS transporter n=1 Tax=Lactobacillus sp. ESL0677 TaxID=2983208 RepID=UPI0023F8026B|nr:MFS transporter [Lactobacillus sp. ESL0677]WEV36462.1 MFS transporter [Lactobacillus sp. ESL0677]
MKARTVADKIAITFLTFTTFFTLFRSSMAGIFSLFYANSGIPDAQISAIKSWQSVGILVGMLPSGFLADKIGRLKVLNLSAIIISFSFFLLIINPCFIIFSLAEFLYGIGLAFNSGALLAYITDLQEINQIKPSSRLMGQQAALLNIATLIGGNIGTWLFGFKITAPVWFGLLGLAVYPLFVLIFIKVMGFHDNRAQVTTEHINFLKAIAIIIRKKAFWILFLVNIGYDCGTQFLMIYWSIIYVKQLGFNLSIVYTAFMCATIGGAWVFQQMSGQNFTKLTIASTLCMMLLLCSNSIFSNRYILLAIFLLVELLMGLISGQISALSNRAIYGENNKSLMLSVVSFLVEIIVSLSLIIDDKIIAANSNLTVMYWVSAAYFALILLAVPLLQRSEN